MKWLFVLFILAGCIQNQQQKNTESIPVYTQDTSYNFIVSRNIDSTYSYSILKDQETIIKQDNIPSMPGASGFIDSIDAAKVAEFVMFKMQYGIWPPTVQKQEIDSLLKIQ